ncbi:MAG: glycosyltransferase family 4 protein [Actinomycetota bacterium]|nr:glycosyltransferase family 4 protein [Actinomycetota bacterium]
MTGDSLRISWLMLPGQRPYRELHWLSLMEAAQVTAVGTPRPPEPVQFLERPYRRITGRFTEAASLAWLRGLDSIPETDWVASLELCSLVTGQATGLARRRHLRQAVLLWGNDPGNPLYRLPPYRQVLERARDADLFLCLIHAARDHCVELGFPEERCVVVHPGIDLELFHPAEKPAAEPIAAFISPLASNKGIDRVLEAFDLVRRRLPEARLVVAGRGPLEGMVAQRAEASGGGISFLGRLDRPGVADALRQAAVFVTAPRSTRVWNEQFGLAYVEAMASGLPVVTTICGSNHEAVPEPNRRVPDDREALAEALLWFLGDEGRRAEVGRRNRRYVEEHHEERRQSQLMRDAFASVDAARAG